MNRRLPYAIDLLALGMGAGLDFPGAVRQVVEKSGAPDDPLVEEFTLILQGLNLGRTRRQALEDFAERVPSDAVKEFVGAVVQAELRGNPVAERPPDPGRGVAPAPERPRRRGRRRRRRSPWSARSCSSSSRS